MMSVFLSLEIFASLFASVGFRLRLDDFRELVFRDVDLFRVVVRFAIFPLNRIIVLIIASRIDQEMRLRLRRIMATTAAASETTNRAISITRYGISRAGCGSTCSISITTTSPPTVWPCNSLG